MKKQLIITLAAVVIFTTCVTELGISGAHQLKAGMHWGMQSVQSHETTQIASAADEADKLKHLDAEFVNAICASTDQPLENAQRLISARVNLIEETAALPATPAFRKALGSKLEGQSAYLSFWDWFNNNNWRGRIGISVAASSDGEEAKNITFVHAPEACGADFAIVFKKTNEAQFRTDDGSDWKQWTVTPAGKAVQL